MDKTDRTILNNLQKNGRVTYNELSEILLTADNIEIQDLSTILHMISTRGVYDSLVLSSPDDSIWASYVKDDVLRIVP